MKSSLPLMPRRPLMQRLLYSLYRVIAGTTPAKANAFRCRSLMTARELAIHQGVTRQMPHIVLHAQVIAAAIIEPKCSAGSQEWWHLRNQYCQRIIDFVATTPDGRIIALIEIDDKTHDYIGKHAKDAERDTLMADLGLRSLRYNGRTSDIIAALCSDLQQLTGSR